MALTVKSLYHTYQPGTPNESHALKNIDLTIEEGEFVGIIGHTGSGKSTLVQHLNGLLKPTQGEVLLDGVNINAKSTKLKEIRLQVGLVFQYPEYQLFEETVAKDIAFGPKNLGLEEKEVQKRVRAAMQTVGLDYETLKNQSPFDLSGGQKRRIAIAGVLAMSPKYLILDEPTAGLDPKGREEILEQVKRLKGEIALSGTPREVFRHYDELRQLGVGVPTVTDLMHQLRQKGMPVSTDIITLEEAKAEILRVLREEGRYA